MKEFRRLFPLIFIFTSIVGCEKEKNELTEPEFIFSSDTLIFNENETKELFISTKPASEGAYQIISYPDWVSVYPESGYFYNDFKKITITSNIEANEPGLYIGELILMSHFGTDTVILLGIVGEKTIYSVPDLIEFNVFDQKEILHIENNGNINLNFNAVASNDLIILSKTSGDILVGQQENIVIDINSNDLETGSYQSEIYLTLNDLKDTVLVSIEFFNEQKNSLFTNVIDAEYSKEVDKLFFVSSNPFSLSIFNTQDKSIEQISLTYIPTCISISSDGTEAVVGHDGKISYIDLLNKNIKKSIDVSCYVFDIAFGNNGWAYAIPYVGTHVRVHCINLVDNTSIEHLGVRNIMNGSKIKLHPSGNSLYLADNGVSPSDLQKLDIENDTAKYLYDSPYHGDYAVSGDLWFSEDGQRIFTRGKSVFKTSVLQEQDMLYNGKITLESSSNGYNKIQWLDHSENMNNLYLISTGEYDEPNLPYVYVHNSTNLVYKEKLVLEKYPVPDGFGSGTFYEPEPYYVFSNSNGNKLWIITKAVESGLLNEWSIQTVDI